MDYTTFRLVSQAAFIPANRDFVSVVTSFAAKRILELKGMAAHGGAPAFQKEVAFMCNNGLFGTNCCTWLIVILLLVLFNNEGIFGNGCGCNNNCGCNNGCGC